MRNFEKWLGKFKNSIATYDYYIDLKKVIKNVDNIKIELNILNSLIGSKNIEKDFENIIKKYPETLKCIPILLAIRDMEIYAQDEEGSFLYNFKSPNYSIEQYKIFMRKTGLFDLIQNHIINNLVDYVLGVETGLDSNGRKNRGGHLMEDLVEKYIVKAGFIKGVNYFKEMKISEIEEKFKIDLSKISNNGKTVKRFDFVIKTENMIYAIERCKEKINFEFENSGKVYIHKGDARKLDFIKDESIDFICTHPPYANIIEYSENIDEDLSHLKIPEFLKEIKKVASESHRVLKKDKFCAILMGDTRIKGHIQPLGFEVMKIFEGVGFKLKEIIIKEQHNCKATGYWKTNSIKYNFFLIAHEYLFIFKK